MDLAGFLLFILEEWIPAFAGMTKREGRKDRKKKGAAREPHRVESAPTKESV